MHPLFSTRLALPAYLLVWAGLSVLPGLVLTAGAGGTALALLATLGLALASMPVYFACRALPIGVRRLGRVLGVQSAIALALSLFFAVELEVGAHALSVLPSFRDLPEAVAARRAPTFGVGVLLSLLVLAFHYLLASVEARGLAQEREAQALLARQRAELGALRAQVHPHFLFNSLNTVSALIGYDPARAREACVELGTYLRKTLGAGERPFVTLGEEWELARTYLGVEGLRLGERLQIEQRLDPAALGVQVPSLLLQPLIENAVTHGIAQADLPTPLSVRAERRGERLLIEIENAYAEARTTRAGRSGGLGLANVRARLFAHYGAQASLSVERRAGNFLVRLELPARAALEAS